MDHSSMDHSSMDHSSMDHSQMDHSSMDHSSMDHSSMDHSSMNGVNPCTDILTDIEYLEHMIPHHQVAIDMSHMLIPKSNNPIVLHLCRDIIRKQGYEIWEMGLMKKRLPETVYSSQDSYKENFHTKMDLHAPTLSRAKEGECNPLFFKPNDHSSHMKGMKLTEKSYLEHMIPHHQVAIDMSRRLMLHTNHSYLMDFCRKLILDQQGEIFYMNSLLKNTYTYKSELLD
jgi:uncharacterized protein (DUF305 family)